jgi:hypothetical protein
MIDRLRASFMRACCRVQPFCSEHLTFGAVRKNAKEDILIFMIAELAFTENAVKEASFFYGLCIFFTRLLDLVMLRNAIQQYHGNAQADPN